MAAFDCSFLGVTSISLPLRLANEHLFRLSYDRSCNRLCQRVHHIISQVFIQLQLHPKWKVLEKWVTKCSHHTIHRDHTLWAFFGMPSLTCITSVSSFVRSTRMSICPCPPLKVEYVNLETASPSCWWATWSSCRPYQPQTPSFCTTRIADCCLFSWLVRNRNYFRWSTNSVKWRDESTCTAASYSIPNTSAWRSTVTCHLQV